MPASVIPPSALVLEDLRAARRAALVTSMASLTEWLTTEAPDLALHHVAGALRERLTQVALAALSLWAALRLDDLVPPCRLHGGASYTFEGWRVEPVRTGFGTFESLEPLYLRHQGKGPKRLLPHGRRMQLAAGRMSLGVHLRVAALAARLPFNAVREVAKTVGLWVPGRRAMYGIIDALGDHASAAMRAPPTPAPETEGTHIVIEQDDGGIPHVTRGELEKRRKPNRRSARGPQTRRARRRERRGRRHERRRRRTGDKSKNCRMATTYVVYSLMVHPDGSVEGPLNRQVFSSTGDKEALRKAVLDAAKARGWGSKPSVYLADGATTHWKAWKKHFHQGTPCLDWYHVAEYLWQAAEAVFRVSRPPPAGKRARSNHRTEVRAAAADRNRWVRARQDELLAGDITAVERHIQALYKRIGRSGPGTRTRRKKVQAAATYIENHREFLTYAKIGDVVMGTGVVESTIKQIGMRLKGPGMRWSTERAEHVLALRCLQLSDGDAWERFERRVQEAHEATTNLHVPSVSPTKVVTPHIAVPKAA